MELRRVSEIEADIVLFYTEFWSAFYFNNLGNETANSVTKFVMTLNEEQKGNEAS